MSENIKEEESKPALPNQPQEAPEMKSEMTPAFALGEQLNKVSDRLEGKAALSRIKESAARLRVRLYRGRGII
jgi:hypothetical protein